ncbi:hypothetical protein Zmor_020661 [Zophobas morio]|uniref:Uncharacterized protein n=1 Tax=Zophobas morio TaxID=2755281 RepID=A0AA38MAK8_9CUCU|nr:hypothetical protein Zmor_020661 [Zophobas morio]
MSRRKDGIRVRSVQIVRAASDFEKMSLDEIAFVRGVGTAERTGRLRPNESVAGLIRIKEGQALNFSLAVAQRY